MVGLTISMHLQQFEDLKFQNVFKIPLKAFQYGQIDPPLLNFFGFKFLLLGRL